MNKEFTEIERLVADERFRKWVFNPDAETEAYWEHWSKKHAAKLNYLHQAKDILLAFQSREENLSKESIEQEFDKIRIAIHRKEQKRRSWLKWAAAASLLLIIASGIIIINFYSFKYDYQTAFGEKQNIILPDESKVVLNANSRIKFNEWDEKREVWLDGEAFFEVKKQYNTAQENIKFIVHTGNLDVEVIGTQFNVTERHGETQVVLSEGKIKLSLQDHKSIKEVKMLPGDMVIYGDGRFHKKSVKPRNYSSWLDNRMVFEETPLNAVAKRIEDIYGYTIVFNDKEISGRKISGTVPSDNLEMLLRGLKKAFDIRIEQIDETIIIKPNNN